MHAQRDACFATISWSINQRRPRGCSWLQVKKVYMKANLLVHPDKVRQRNGGPEQVAIADMVFDVLKEAWNAFNK